MGTRERTRPDTSGKPGYITAEGYLRLEKEVDYLWNKKRPEVTEALSVAAAEGDRSENAEYIYRKRQLGRDRQAASFSWKKTGCPNCGDRKTKTGRQGLFRQLCYS